jgi:hypothetical protein
MATRSTRNRVKTAAEYAAHVLLMLLILYLIGLFLWHLHYPVCLPGYAPEVFRLFDQTTCTYSDR